MPELPSPEPARTEDLAPACRLAFRHLEPADLDGRIANFLRLVGRGEIDPSGIFVLRQGGGITGALITACVPGAGALVWPPGSIDDPLRTSREDLLLQHGLRWLRGRAVKVFQALLAPGEEHLAEPLARNGLPHVTDLWYLRHPLRDLRAPLTPPRLTFEPYDPANPVEFHATHVATYTDTQDCPELTGARTIDEILEGHRAQGLFDPDRWWLARLGGVPAGVLLTIEIPESEEWEVAYMGLVPAARGQGLGQELLRKGLREAAAARAPGVILSVDARNAPAWKLYRTVGFEPYDRRAVYLAVRP